MVGNNAAYKYEIPCKGPFVITQCLTNVTVTLQCDTIKLDIIYVALDHINMIQTLKILIHKLMIGNVTLLKYFLSTYVSH